MSAKVRSAGSILPVVEETDSLAPAIAAWYAEREDQLVEREISLIRVYQFKMPDGIGPYRGGPWPSTWWEEFWRSLERVSERREEYLRLWRERHQDGGRQTELAGYLEMDPALCPYKRHGQQRLRDFGIGGGEADG